MGMYHRRARILRRADALRVVRPHHRLLFDVVDLGIELGLNDLQIFLILFLGSQRLLSHSDQALMAFYILCVRAENQQSQKSIGKLEQERASLKTKQTKEKPLEFVLKGAKPKKGQKEVVIRFDTSSRRANGRSCTIYFSAAPHLEQRHHDLASI
jgi:hypothetical protein